MFPAIDRTASEQAVPSEEPAPERGSGETVPLRRPSSRNGRRKRGRKRPSATNGARRKQFYTYAVLPGNNSRCILSLFRSRPWWTPVSTDAKRRQAGAVDTVWEMWKNPSRYRTRAQSAHSALGASSGDGGGDGKPDALAAAAAAAAAVVDAADSGDRDIGSAAASALPSAAMAPPVKRRSLGSLLASRPQSVPGEAKEGADPHGRDRTVISNAFTLLNHFVGNGHLVSKRGMFLSLQRYCLANGLELSEFVPTTYYLNARAVRTVYKRSGGVVEDEAAGGNAEAKAGDSDEDDGYDEDADEDPGTRRRASSTAHRNISPHEAALRDTRLFLDATGLGAEAVQRVLQSPVEPAATGTTRRRRSRSKSRSNSNVIKSPGAEVLDLPTGTGVGNGSGIGRHDGDRGKGDGVDGSCATPVAGGNAADERDSIWILKPASCSNRGQGIEVVFGAEEALRTVVWGRKKSNKSGTKKTKRKQQQQSSRKRKSSSTRADDAEAVVATGRPPPVPPLAAARRQSKPTQQQDDHKQQQAEKKGAGAVSIGVATARKPTDSAACAASTTSVAPVSSNRVQNKHGWIVQAYLERPLLVHNRKFDMRIYVLLVSQDIPMPHHAVLEQHSCCQGRCSSDNRPSSVRGYVYRDGYVRTSCAEYSTNRRRLSDKMVHLTNDAVQKKSAHYGKFEAGNKLSMDEFQEYLNSLDRGDIPSDFVRGPMFDSICTAAHHSIAAVADRLNPQRRRRCFELYGYDFMVTDDLEVFLIEVNTNPCLEFSSPMLEDLLRRMTEDAMQLVLDPCFPPPSAPSVSTGSTDGGGPTRKMGDAVSELELRSQQNGFVAVF